MSSVKLLKISQEVLGMREKEYHSVLGLQHSRSFKKLLKLIWLSFSWILTCTCYIRLARPRRIRGERAWGHPIGPTNTSHEVNVKMDDFFVRSWRRCDCIYFIDGQFFKSCKMDLLDPAPALDPNSHRGDSMPWIVDTKVLIWLSPHATAFTL